MSETHVRDPRTIWASILPGPASGRADDPSGVREAVPVLRRIALRAEPARDDGGVPSPDGENIGQGAVPGGRRGASGSRGSDGDAFRTARGRGDRDGPDFSLEVPPDGYAWWYADGLSPDGTRAISIIGFIGSVFSPWYAWSGRRRPENHVCLNVATYGPGGRFSMTDRGVDALRQSRNQLTIGPSSMRWMGERLVINVDERGAAPFFGQLRGRITLLPSAVTSVELPLCPDGGHVWRPFAPVSRIEVDLEAAGWQWEGHGYFDANFGTRALEHDFSTWTWGRFPTGGGSTCFYEARRRDGTDLSVAARFAEDGSVETIIAPPPASLARTCWALARGTRADAGYRPKQVKAMLDAPFYCRSAVRTMIDGIETTGVHEALDLDRFRSPLLKPMIALRVPRRARWRFD